MCGYCETAYDKNDSGREYGKFFDKTLDYTGEVQLSWIKENGMKTGYELYMNDNAVCTDLSVPVDFCPKCGRNLNLGECAQAMEEIEFDAEYGQKYTIEQLIDAITQAEDELICAIQYRDRAGVEDAIREYLNNINI